jgi:basic membrane lipoprotein Med (substrate-binding protein (PBP1-ABC) superfamily)
MMRKTILAAAGVLAIAAAAGPASAEPFKLKGEPKIAFVLFNAKDDGGWTQAQEEARIRIEQARGIEIPATEKVAEVSTEIRPVVERYISRGYNIINGTAFGYSDTFKELAAEYPEVAFLNAAGTTNGANLQSYYGRTYESQYLCGMVAGAMSKSDKLGFVAANPFGLVIWTVNAYALGAQRMNPDATVTVVYTGAWNDPVKERAATEALIEQGIDVIGMHVDTPTMPTVAQEKGVYATGHHRDMTEFAPKSTLCSSVWVWDPFLNAEFDKITAGTWEPAPYGAFLGIKDGGPDIACCHADVPKEVVDQVMAARQEIIDGKHVYAGPLSDKDGNEKVAAGAVLDDGALWGMDWYVKGVIAQQ